MKVVACVKAVPDAANGLRLDPATMRLDRGGDLALSAYDANAVEEALRIRENAGEGEVVVLTLGPDGAAPVLRKALAMGADRAVHVLDDAFTGADLVGTAHGLAGGLRREVADLVLFGQQSADGEGACLPAAVAELLLLPVISQVAALEVGGGAVTGRRQTELGYERIRAPLPAVVAVSDAINDPRYPTLRGIMGAKAKPLETLSAVDLGGAERARTAVLALAPPPRRGETRRVEDGAGAAEAIVEFLAERRLV